MREPSLLQLFPFLCKRCTDTSSCGNLCEVTKGRRWVTTPAASWRFWPVINHLTSTLFFSPFKKCGRTIKKMTKVQQIIGVAACRKPQLCLFVLDDSVGQPTPSSLQRGCWPTSWGSCWWFSGCCWATWSPRTSSDVRRTRRKSPCPSTSRPSPRASPRPRPEPGEAAWPWHVAEDLGSPFVKRRERRIQTPHHHHHHHLSIHFVVNVSFKRTANSCANLRCSLIVLVAVGATVRLCDGRPTTPRCVESELLLKKSFFMVLWFTSDATQAVRVFIHLG